MGGGDVDDAPTLFHQRHRLLQRQEGARDVDGHDALEVGGIGALEARPVNDAAALMQASRQALSAAITRKAAASKPISLVSLTDEQIEQTGAARQTIPGGTYPGIDEDVETTSLPVIAYTTSAMDEETAYTLTRTFWERRDAMAEETAWWGGITHDMIGNIACTLHPGAVRYYDEAGNDIPDSLRCSLPSPGYGARHCKVVLISLISSASAALSVDATESRLHPVWVVLGAISVIFHLGLIFYGLTPALVSRPIHMALALPWILILMARTRAERWSGWLLTLRSEE